jgi:hypothetical protein
MTYAAALMLRTWCQSLPQLWEYSLSLACKQLLLCLLLCLLPVEAHVAAAG